MLLMMLECGRRKCRCLPAAMVFNSDEHEQAVEIAQAAAEVGLQVLIAEVDLQVEEIHAGPPDLIA
jgi:hypothetical protein